VTAAGFWAGLQAIAPGKTQRQVEGATIRGAFEAGADGPSLWPWVRSGPNTNLLFQAMADYHNLNRAMGAGDVVRLDVGFDVDGYKGDFGRTLPVSGRFDDAQRETLTLLNGAYLAGLHAMKPGATPRDVTQASIEYLRAHQSEAQTPAAQESVRRALANGVWPLHGLGMDMAEGTPSVFRAGNVICYEPGMLVNGQLMFVEDTIVITSSGFEILNPPLPYAPRELEGAMRPR
jgi:Xaa-Pro aminopeptidase